MKKKFYVELGNNRCIYISFFNNIAKYEFNTRPIVLKDFIEEYYKNNEKDKINTNSKLIINLNKK